MELLIESIGYGSKPHFEKVLKNNPILTFSDIEGKRNILHIAVSSSLYSDFYLGLLLQNMNKVVLKYLIDQENEIKMTPLSLACITGKWKCAFYLLDYGANANLVSKRKDDLKNCLLSTPLSCAIRYFTGKPKETKNYKVDFPVGQTPCTNIIEKLLICGANPNESIHTDYHFPSPFWCAVNSKKAWIVRLLLKHGAIVNSTRIELVKFGTRFNILEEAMKCDMNTNKMSEIIIGGCKEDLKYLIDTSTLITSLIYGNQRIIDVILAFYVEHQKASEEDCKRIATTVISISFRRNNRIIKDLLLLLPNFKNTVIIHGKSIYFGVEAWAEKCGNREAVEMIRRNDGTLFEMLSLRISQEALRNEILNKDI